MRTCVRDGSDKQSFSATSAGVANLPSGTYKTKKRSKLLNWSAEADLISICMSVSTIPGAKAKKRMPEPEISALLSRYLCKHV